PWTSTSTPPGSPTRSASSKASPPKANPGSTANQAPLPHPNPTRLRARPAPSCSPPVPRPTWPQQRRRSTPRPEVPPAFRCWSRGRHILSCAVRTPELCLLNAFLSRPAAERHLGVPDRDRRTIQLWDPANTDDSRSGDGAGRPTQTRIRLNGLLTRNPLHERSQTLCRTGLR